MSIRSIVSALLLSFALSGCGSGAGVVSEAKAEVLGPAATPAEHTEVTVQDLVEQEKWKGQKIVFSGSISQIGCGGCGGVIVADKTWRISAEPADPSQFKIPVKPGTPIRIWGVLGTGDGGVKEVKASRVELGPAPASP